MLDEPFVLPGVFWDNNADDVDEWVDGEPAVISIFDDELICITSPTGMEVRLNIYELEAILEYARACEINDLRSEN